MIGVVNFPFALVPEGVNLIKSSQKDQGGIGTVYVSKDALPDVEYMMLSASSKEQKSRLYVNTDLAKDTSSFACILSAWDRTDDGTSKVYITYAPETVDMTGASLGLAAFLALMGYRLEKTRYAFTGYVVNFGNDVPDDISEMEVQPVQEIATKHAVCIRRDMILVGNTSLNNGPNLINVRTMRDVFRLFGH